MSGHLGSLPATGQNVPIRSCGPPSHQALGTQDPRTLFPNGPEPLHRFILLGEDHSTHGHGRLAVCRWGVWEEPGHEGDRKTNGGKETM